MKYNLIRLIRKIFNRLYNHNPLVQLILFFFLCAFLILSTINILDIQVMITFGFGLISAELLQLNAYLDTQNEIRNCRNKLQQRSGNMIKECVYKAKKEVYITGANNTDAIYYLQNDTELIEYILEKK